MIEVFFHGYFYGCVTNADRFRQVGCEHFLNLLRVTVNECLTERFVAFGIGFDMVVKPNLNLIFKDIPNFLIWNLQEKGVEMKSGTEGIIIITLVGGRRFICQITGSEQNAP